MSHENYDDDEEGSSEVVDRIACENCRELGADNSGDNLVIYADGHGHCYACGKHESGDSTGRESVSTPRTPIAFTPLIFTTEQGLKARHISGKTCKFFSYGIGRDSYGNAVHICNIHATDGTLIAQKTRSKDKDFYVLGSIKTKPLIGMHKWRQGGRKLVITEGEIDMLSYGELTDCKYPVVSLPNGVQSAKKSLLANIDFLKKFEEIILMFDMDEAGENAANECFPILPIGRLKRAVLPLKDANACLMDNQGQAVVKSVWNAEAYKPTSIVRVSDIIEKALQPPVMGLSLPWPSATKATLGVRRGEIHIVGAAPKIGKTEFQHQLTKHFTDEHNERLGVFSLEENPVKTLKKIAGKYANKQFTKPPEIGCYTQEEARLAMEGLEDKIEFYSSEGVRDADEILNIVRYWAAQGIWLFIVDPLTALVAEHDSSSANDILNSFMSKAASLAMELQITFFMFSHVNPPKAGKPHDQGGDVLSSQFTGSRAMEKWAHYGWAIMRNRDSDDPIIRNTARVKMLFDREFGEACTFHSYYDSERNDWSECPPPDSEAPNPFNDETFEI
jgi:twinkle protein|tara:strand:+ start:6367 stop:8049 length:1683 start_codon:yes stop_codon:yes gene_type:complete